MTYQICTNCFWKICKNSQNNSLVSIFWPFGPD